MTVLQAIVLGVLQGLTEFLPISSSGHLVIGQKLFGLSQPPVLFDILVHLGTLLAILMFFKDKLLKLKKNAVLLIIIGTIPAISVGLVLNNYLNILFNSLSLVGINLLITAFLLFSTKLVAKKEIINLQKDKKEKKVEDLKQLNPLKSFLIGCFQALAILPGVSRSGSTIIGGLWSGLKKETAFDFSFYLAVPAIIGALVLQIPDISNNCSQLLSGLIGLIMAALSGYLSLGILRKVVLKNRLFYFGFYCLALGLGVLIFLGV